MPKIGLFALIVSLSPAMLSAGAPGVGAGAGESLDEVYLIDGSRLVGRIEQMSGGALLLATDFAGQLKIDTAKVRGVTSPRRFTLAMKDGSRAAGVPQYDAATGQQRVTGTTFGDVTLTVDQLVGLWPEGQPEPPDIGLAPAEQEKMAEIKARQEVEIEKLAAEHLQQLLEVKDPPPPPPYEQWTARIEIGLNGKTGNTERTSFHGRAQALRSTPVDRLLMYLEGNYAKDNGVESQNEVFGGAKWERDLTERWFVFLKTELERDEFEMLDLRAIVTGGAGYFFIKQADHELKGRVGAGVQHESYQDGTNTNDIILEAGYDYRLDINDWLRFTHSLTWYPVIEDPAHDYRLFAETAGEIPLGDVSIWKLRAGMRNEYDALPPDGIERMDTSYFLNLVAEWK